MYVCLQFLSGVGQGLGGGQDVMIAVGGVVLICVGNKILFVVVVGVWELVVSRGEYEIFGAVEFLGIDVSFWPWGRRRAEVRLPSVYWDIICFLIYSW